MISCYRTNKWNKFFFKQQKKQSGIVFTCMDLNYALKEPMLINSTSKNTNEQKFYTKNEHYNQIGLMIMKGAIISTIRAIN